MQAAGICVIGALLALVLKKGSPELALLLTLAAGVTVMLLLSSALEQLTTFLQELADRGGMDQKLFIPLYKTVGIALVVKTGGNLCRDAGESALASVLETAGTVCALLVALPLLQTVLKTLT